METNININDLENAIAQLRSARYILETAGTKEVTDTAREYLLRGSAATLEALASSLRAAAAQAAEDAANILGLAAGAKAQRQAAKKNANK